MNYRIVVTKILIVCLLVMSTGLVSPVWAGDDEKYLQDELEIVYDVLRFIMRFGLEEVEVQQLVQGAIRGMIDAIGDPYSHYLDRENYQSLLQQLDPTISGIGVIVTARGGYVTVVSPIRGTPAEKAGLKPNDRIIAVDGIDVVGAATEQVVQRLRGDAGTQVRVTVLRPETGETFTVTIIRALIQVPTIESEVIPPGIGYIRISMFGDKTASEFAAHFARLEAQGITSLVIDLRYNGGGFMGQGIEIADRFVPEGPITYLERKDGEMTAYRSETPAWGKPVAILVNEGTASTSEILAASLQDWQQATIVGTRTFGKSTIQTIASIPLYGGIRLTTAEYLTPIGRSLRDTGIEPDIVVPPSEYSRPSLHLDHSLSRGASGELVAKLQAYITELGYGVLAADGIYGPLTQMAVIEFQRTHGFEASGIVTPDQGEFINRLLAYVRDKQLAKAIEIVKHRLQ